MLTNRIHVHRAEKGWTQQDLASQVEVSRQTINNIEKSKYTPSITLAFKIARVFNVEVTDIFNYTEEE